jgi:cytochrome c-type biogenesis protein
VAANEDQVLRGALLLVAYSAGLGLPFLATGLAFGRLTGAFGWVKRHTVALTTVSAASLCFFGVLLTFNRLTWVTSRLQETAQALGLGWLVRLG